MAEVSASRNSAIASANRASPIQWADHVGVGNNPRDILCTPCAPPSKLRNPCTYG